MRAERTFQCQSHTFHVREGSAASPARCQSQLGAPAACPTWGGKGWAKETVKNINLQSQVKTHFTFFSLFELNGKKQILSPSQMGHGVLAHY